MNTTMTAREAVARAIRGRAAETRTKREALASSVGLSLSGLAKKLSGESTITGDDLQRFADALGTTMADLIRRAESIQSENAA